MSQPRTMLPLTEAQELRRMAMDLRANPVMTSERIRELRTTLAWSAAVMEVLANNADELYAHLSLLCTNLYDQRYTANGPCAGCYDVVDRFERSWCTEADES